MQIREEIDPRRKFLDPDIERKILRDWVKVDKRRTVAGRRGETIRWIADFDLPVIGDNVIVWPGCCYATVIDYSIKEFRGEFERAVWVLLDNAEIIKLVGRECRMLTKDDKEMIERLNGQFRERLVESGKKLARQKKERRAKVVIGSHLLDRMMEMANGLDVERTSGFHKITGSKKKLAVYVSLKGGRVDLNGFCVDHPAITPMTEEEARDKHLGRVRGQVDFTKGDGPVLEAFGKALDELR